MRAAAALAALAAVLTAGGCASVTAGTGTGGALRSSFEPRFPSESASAAPSSSSSSPAPSSTPATTSVVPSPSVHAVPPPRICASGRCHAIGTAPLDDGYQVVVFSAPSPSGGVAATVTALSRDRVAVYWHVTDNASPSQIVCSTSPQPNCGLALFVGAHASEAIGLLRIGDGFRPYAEADSNTPTTKVGDLNGDGWIDASAIQNTYRPSYATGKVYWQTSTSNGREYTATGCTVPSHNPARTAPTAPLTGSCPPSS